MSTLSLKTSGAISWGLPLIIVAVLWLQAIGQTGELIRSVSQVTTIAAFETQYLYYYLHLFAFVPVFCLSFDRKVAYFKSWRALFPAIAIVGLIFILWDIFFTHIDIWGFNAKYFADYSIFGLPVEECLFFLTIPFATIFIYECLNAYFPKDVLAKYDRSISISLIILFFGVGIFNFDRLYTATTFLLTGGFLLFHYLFVANHYRTLFYRAYLLSLLPFFMINGVLTGGYTHEPVVMYNPEEFMGLRIGSVPIEDAIYSFLLLFAITAIFEYFRRKKEGSRRISEAGEKILK